MKYLLSAFIMTLSFSTLAEELDTSLVEVNERSVFLKGSVEVRGKVLCTLEKGHLAFKQNQQELALAKENHEKVEVDGVYCYVKRIPKGESKKDLLKENEELKIRLSECRENSGVNVNHDSRLQNKKFDDIQDIKNKVKKGASKQ